MGENSAIQWCDHTFNAWMGCEKVSEGCKHCYAEDATPVRVHRGRGLELWGKGAARHVTGDDNWRKPVQWNRAAEVAGIRRRVFAQSLSDTFEDRRDLDAPRARLFALIESTPWLDWLVLTKRPENMVRLAPASWAERWPANVWAGCTVENQAMAHERIPALLRIPAAVRFLSMEPLLGPVDISEYLARNEAGSCSRCGCAWTYADDREPAMRARRGHVCPPGYGGHIDWIIIGGESGSKARPFDVAWARSLMKQAREAGIAPFVKQLGAYARGLKEDHFYLHNYGLCAYDKNRLTLNDGHGGDMAEWPADLHVRDFPALAVPS